MPLDGFFWILANFSCFPREILAQISSYIVAERKFRTTYCVWMVIPTKCRPVAAKTMGFAQNT